MTEIKYYYLDASRVPTGPFSLSELSSLSSQGKITKETLVAEEGGAAWVVWETLILPLAAQTDNRGSILSKKTYNNFEDLTPDLRAKLKGYGSHTNLSCLECGYTGLMGVTGKIVPWYLSYWLWVPIYFLIGLTGATFVGSFILGLIVGFIRSGLLKKKTVCPACDKNLISIEKI